MEMPITDQEVDLEFLNGPYTGSFSVRVIWRSDEFLRVTQPTIDGRPASIAAGDPVRLSFCIPGMAKVIWETRVGQVGGRTTAWLSVKVPPPEEVRRIQKRDYYRMEISVDLTYSVLARPDGKAYAALRSQTYTRDLSGSGAQVIFPENYPPGTQMDFWLQIEDQRVHTIAEVVRYIERISPTQFWLGVRFVGLEERDRNLIIRYLFKLQRERCRAGLV